MRDEESRPSFTEVSGRRRAPLAGRRVAPDAGSESQLHTGERLLGPVVARRQATQLNLPGYRTGRPMDGAERQSRVRTFVDEVWNGGNYGAAAELYSEHYSNPFGVGPEARIEPIRRYREAFPDLHLDIEDLIVAGDTVVLRVATPRYRHGRIRGPGPDGTGRGGMGGHHHALRGRQGRPGMDRGRQARPLHSAWGRRRPVADVVPGRYPAPDPEAHRVCPRRSSRRSGCLVGTPEWTFEVSPPDDLSGTVRLGATRRRRAETAPCGDGQERPESRCLAPAFSRSGRTCSCEPCRSRPRSPCRGSRAGNEPPG